MTSLTCPTHHATLLHIAGRHRCPECLHAALTECVEAMEREEREWPVLRDPVSRDVCRHVWTRLRKAAERGRRGL